MPIRFRCAYCNQLMAIARRKAGTVVRCPTCSGQVVVPTVESPAQAPTGKTEDPRPVVFERSDFDQVFTTPAPPPRPGAFPPAGEPSAALPGPIDVEPLQFPPVLGPTPYSPTPPGLVLTPVRMVLLFLAVALLMGLAFLAGFLLGRASAG